MQNKKTQTPQTSLILRLVCGGYLLYLAWDLRSAFQDSPLYLAAAIVFGAAGLVLAIHSLRALTAQHYFRKTDTESNKDREEQIDE